MKFTAPTLLSLISLLQPIAARDRPQAVTTAKASPACLRQDMVWGWKVINDKTLIVTDRAQNVYKVSLKPGCFDLNWHTRLSFRSVSGFGISCLTRNDSVLVPPAAGLPLQVCFISNVGAYKAPPPSPK